MGMRHYSSALIIPILLLALCAAPAGAGVNWWTPIGPEGGVITSLAVDPATRTLYAAASGDVFVSRNGGTTWERRSRGLESVSHVAASSVPAPVVYAAAEGFLYRSTDGGVSWVASSRYPGSGGTWALAVDPSDSSKVYVGTPFDGIMKSTDGGATWSAVFDDASCGFIYSLEISVTAPSTLYVGCESGQTPFFKSTDGGVTWTAAGSSLPDGGQGIVLALAPGAAGVLYASTRILVGIEYEWRTYKSLDDGATWTRLAVSGSPVEAGPGGLVFVGKHRSTDGGQTWHELPLPVVPDSLLLDPGNPAVVYAGLLPGVYRSADAGATWTPRSRGLFAAQIQALEIDPQEPTLYAVIRGLGVRKRAAGQARWRRADAGLPLDDVFASFETPALAIDPVEPSNLYLGWPDGFARSSNGGASWTALPYEEDGCVFIRELDVDPRDPDRIYAAGVLSREGSCSSPSGPICLIFHSDDAGATWTCAGPAPLDVVTELVVDPSSQPSRLYAATLGEGVWMSADRGGTWRKLKGLRRFNNVFTAFAVDPTDSRRLYAGDLYGRVYKSIDRGATWTEASRGLPQVLIRQIVVDPQRSQTVYAVDAGGIYISGNRGQTWHPLNGGLASAPWILLLDPTNSRKLYAGTARTGVYAHERR
jgi:photosystem II stability/assembly factor-like uncharacterized protein